MASADALRALRPPRAGRPAYLQIEEQLLDLIERGALAPGARVPAERELAAVLSVSRMTLRQALDGLVRRGLLERASGRGTFVSAPKLDQDLRALRTLPEELRTQGVEPGSLVLAIEDAAAPSRIAAALCLPAGAATLRLERLRSASAEPLLYEICWLPASLASAVRAVSLEGSLWDALRDAGRPVARAVELLEPVVAGAHEADLLAVERGAPLMRVERTAYDAADRPLEFAIGLVRGDRARFIVQVPASSSRPIGHTPRP